MPRHLVIGDVHGCYAELCDLLDVLSPTRDDTVVLLGDLINRGPDSAAVLRYARDTPGVVALQGNHEYEHLLADSGGYALKPAQALTRRLLGEEYPAWLRFMAALPLYRELPEAVLVHGLLEPGVPLAAQRPDVLVGAATGEAHVRTHYPTPWYEHYDGPRPVVVGHHDYLRTAQPLVREGRVYGIDTGCVHGGRLTALVLPDFRLVSVPARADYWTPLRARLGRGAE
jgi:serine/threonine protein phosphatase 1